MLQLVLVLVIPYLIAADTTCPDGKLSCKEGQSCCTVNNKPSCCDDVEVPHPSLSEMLISSVRNSSVQNGTYDAFGFCSKNTCRGVCCNNNNFCCEHELGNCCGTTYRCCPWLEDCCGNPPCCAIGYKCCGGAFCCKTKQTCGLYSGICLGGAGSLSPTTLVTLVAAWVVAYAVKKL